MKSMKGITILFLHKCHITFHIRCNKDFKWAHRKTLDFLSMDRLWVGVKKFMHDMFVFTISTIETPWPGMNIVFNKMRSFHLTMWWNHIDLYFGTKDYCNVICIIFMHKLFPFNKIKYFLTQFQLSKYTLPKFIFSILKIKVSNLLIYLCLAIIFSLTISMSLHLQNKFNMNILTYFITF